MKNCPCCNRSVREEDLTLHHYLPKCEGGTLKETITLCKTCHQMLHKYIPISHVKYYKNIEDLEENELFNQYLQWIRSKNHPHQYPVKKVIRYLKRCHLVA